MARTSPVARGSPATRSRSGWSSATALDGGGTLPAVPGAHEAGARPGLQALDEQVPGDRGHGGIPRPRPVAVRGVRVQAVAVCRGPDGPRVEVGALQEHPAGPGGDLGPVAAHDARDADGPRLVGDDQVPVREGPLHAVQGHDLLALARPADDDGPADLVGVEGVGRVPEAVQDLVGGVHRRQGSWRWSPCGPGRPGPRQASPGPGPGPARPWRTPDRPRSPGGSGTSRPLPPGSAPPAAPGATPASRPGPGPARGGRARPPRLAVTSTSSTVVPLLASTASTGKPREARSSHRAWELSVLRAGSSCCRALVSISISRALPWS